MRKVALAEPYSFTAMNSFGRASLMIIRQVEFPLTYRNCEPLVSAYDDRCRQADWEHTETCYKKHVVGCFQSWISQARESEVFEFLKDILKVEKTNPNEIWTGFRILGSVNRSSGCPIYTFQLFARKTTKTKTYTGMIAPNVRGSGFCDWAEITT